MKGKRKVHAAVVEQAWKDIIRQADKSRVRKAKQDAKNGAVQDIRMLAGGIAATVKASGPERGTCHVVLPWLADYTGHRASVAKWLAHRPDWVAAHFAGVWETDFIQFLTENGLSVFPDSSVWDDLQQEIKCTCSDWQPLCSHVLALLFHLLWDADEHPLQVFRFVGLNVVELLNEAHHESVTWFYNHTQDDMTNEMEDQQQSGFGPANLAELLNDVEATVPNGRLVPHFISEKLNR